jgi:hypothetical protein
MLLRTRTVHGAITFALGFVLFGTTAQADTINSDTVTVNIKNVNKGGDNPDTISLSIPEVKSVGENKLGIDLSKAVGFLGRRV